MFVVPVSSSQFRRPMRSTPGSLSFAHLLAQRNCDSATADATESRVPTLDVLESDAAYTVVLDVPGVTREQLQVSVDGRRVSVTSVATAPASAQGTPQPDTARVLYRERSVPTYARTVVLPAEVDAATAQARLELGVLTLTLAKRVANGAIRINVA